MKEIYVHLRELAGSLQIGETRRLRCPFCEGGTSRENSFSLSRTSDAECLYCCFRATCSRSGRLACPGFRLTSDTSDSSPRSKRQASIRVFTGRTVALEKEWLSNLSDAYGIFPDEAIREGWKQAVEDGSLVCPIRGPDAVPRGILTRSRTPKYPGEKTHSKLYPQTDGVRQGWFRRAGISHSPVVVVEDVISALKVSRQFTAVALLGTHLDQDRLDEIVSVSKIVVLALDNDATEKAIGYQKKFGLQAEIKVAMLEKDLKYESDERIAYIIKQAR